MTFWRIPRLRFKGLRDAWYRALEAEGFQDAEQMVAEELVLKQNAEHPYRDSDPLEIAAKEAYYRLLAQKSHAEQFSKESDRVIMMLYSEGYTVKAIGDALRINGLEHCRTRRNTITYTIRKYEMLWGLREYTPKQLGKRAS